MVTLTIGSCRHLVFVVVACIATSSCQHGGDPQLGRRVLPLEEVLAPTNFVAEQWLNERWEFEATVSLKEVYEAASLPLRPDEAMRRTWSVASRSGFLQQEVASFDGVGDAREYFREGDPRTYDEDYPLRVDETARYESAGADEFRVYCLGLEGSSDACGLWTYWARYGQYVLRFDYVAGLVFDDPDTDTGVLMPGIDIDRFLGYVRPFDELMTDTLGPSSASRAPE